MISCSFPWSSAQTKDDPSKGLRPGGQASSRWPGVLPLSIFSSIALKTGRPAAWRFALGQDFGNGNSRSFAKIFKLVYLRFNWEDLSFFGFAWFAAIDNILRHRFAWDYGCIFLDLRMKRIKRYLRLAFYLGSSTWCAGSMRRINFAYSSIPDSPEQV